MPVIRYEESKLALGSDTKLVIVSDRPEQQVRNLFFSLWLDIFTFEKNFSRFLPYSELTKFNNNAGLPTKISNEFEQLLNRAKSMSKITDGMYNPFILPALQKAGYDKSFVDRYAEDDIEDYSTRFVANANDIQINEGWAQIPVQTAIDLGGIGKGYLADKLIENKELKKAKGYCFSFGGDIIGDGYDENGNPWTIAIQKADLIHETFDNFYHATGKRFSLATSGTIVRRFTDKVSGEQGHHIIDPKTLLPATTTVKLATIEATSTCEADVFATCAVIAGPNLVKKFIKEKNISSILLQYDEAHSTKYYATGKFSNIITTNCHSREVVLV